jgi:glycosyltransferase involved in cell wall biosynthesis
MYPSDRYPSYGIFVKNAADALVRRGIKVDHCVLHKQDSLLTKASAYLRFFTSTFAHYHLKAYDLVYVHYISHSFAPLLLSGFHKKNKVLIHLHGGDIVPQKDVSAWYSRVKAFIARKAMDRADGIVVPSRFFRDLLISQYGIDEKRIGVVASGGVDLGVFSPRPGYVRHSFTIGYVGRLDYGKGVEVLVRSLAELSTKISDFACVIVGEGTLRASLESLVESFGLQTCVTFVGGKAQRDLPELFSHFDVLAFPTEMEESLGLVGLEAMACGIPVIGSKIGGLQDYLVDGRNGYFCQPGSSTDLAKKIAQMHDLPSESRRRLSQAATETAAQYESNSETEKLMKIVVAIAGTG